MAVPYLQIWLMVMLAEDLSEESLVERVLGVVLWKGQTQF